LIFNLVFKEYSVCDANESYFLYKITVSESVCENSDDLNLLANHTF